MAFLKFLKKGAEKEHKEASSEELELPPPPQISPFASELPSFAGPKLEGMRPSLPPTKPEAPSMPSMGSGSSGIATENAAEPEFGRLPEIRPSDDFYQFRETAFQPGPAKIMPAPSAMPIPPTPLMPAAPAMHGIPDIPRREPQPQEQELAAPPLPPLKPAVTEGFPITDVLKPRLEKIKGEYYGEAGALRAERTERAEYAFEQRPAFIRAQQYRQIMEDIDSMLTRSLSDAEFTRIRGANESEYERLSSCLEDMQRKLMFVDETLFEASA